LRGLGEIDPLKRLQAETTVGELGFVWRSVRNREAVPAFNSHWHHHGYGWRAGFKNLHARISGSQIAVR
jgi:hypothetical protein